MYIYDILVDKTVKLNCFKMCAYIIHIIFIKNINHPIAMCQYLVIINFIIKNN